MREGPLAGRPYSVRVADAEVSSLCTYAPRILLTQKPCHASEGGRRWLENYAGHQSPPGCCLRASERARREVEKSCQPAGRISWKPVGLGWRTRTAGRRLSNQDDHRAAAARLTNESLMAYTPIARVAEMRNGRRVLARRPSKFFLSRGNPSSLMGCLSHWNAKERERKRERERESYTGNNYQCRWREEKAGLSRQERRGNEAVRSSSNELTVKLPVLQSVL